GCKPAPLLVLSDVGPQLLPAGETGVDLVPVADLRFAEAPAQVNLVLIHPAREIDQAGEIIFQFDAEFLELLLEFVHALLIALDIAFHLVGFFLVRLAERAALSRTADPCETLLAFLEIAGQLRDVANDGPNQRQGGIRLRASKVLLLLRRFLNSHDLPPSHKPATGSGPAADPRFPSDTRNRKVGSNARMFAVPNSLSTGAAGRVRGENHFLATA